MNAAKYLNSRMGKTLEAIKRAYLSGKRIIFIITTEPGFIVQLVSRGAVLPYRPAGFNRVSVGAGTGMDGGNVVLATDEQTLAAALSAPRSCPATFICTFTPRAALTSYVNRITGLSCLGKSPQPGEGSNALAQSLILVMADKPVNLPTFLEPYADVVKVPFACQQEFSEIVSSLLNEFYGTPLIEDADGYRLVNNPACLEQLYHCMRGMNEAQIRSVLRKLKEDLGRIDFNDMDTLLKAVRNYSARIISQSTVLTSVAPSSLEPQGMDRVIKWLLRNRARIQYPRLNYAEKPAQGILITGIPGTGKSMMAKYVAKMLGLSLIRMDMGNVLGRYLGEAEERMDESLALVDALSPCVLWVDEIDKAFSGTGSKDGHETTRRVGGKFLTWVQEKGNNGVSAFIFATANDVSSLPPELFRSGRFDEKFYLFMPSAEECSRIFESHILHQCEVASRSEADRHDCLPLFDVKKVNAGKFLELLNDNCCLTDRLEPTDTKVTRLNKFFTGSDIENLIEKAKTHYLHVPGMMESEEHKRHPKAKFESSKFLACLRTVIAQETRTYGETNLEDIAKCLAMVAKYNPQPASNHVILPPEGYDRLRRFYLRTEGERMNDFNLYELPQEQEHLRRLTNDYDRQLYLAIRNAVNAMKMELVNL